MPRVRTETEDLTNEQQVKNINTAFARTPGAYAGMKEGTPTLEMRKQYRNAPSRQSQGNFLTNKRSRAKDDSRQRLLDSINSPIASRNTVGNAGAQRQYQQQMANKQMQVRALQGMDEVDTKGRNKLADTSLSGRISGQNQMNERGLINQGRMNEQREQNIFNKGSAARDRANALQDSALGLFSEGRIGADAASNLQHAAGTGIRFGDINHLGGVLPGQQGIGTRGQNGSSGKNASTGSSPFTSSQLSMASKGINDPKSAYNVEREKEGSKWFGRGKDVGTFFEHMKATQPDLYKSAFADQLSGKSSSGTSVADAVKPQGTQNYRSTGFSLSGSQMFTNVGTPPATRSEDRAGDYTSPDFPSGSSRERDRVYGPEQMPVMMNQPSNVDPMTSQGQPQSVYPTMGELISPVTDRFDLYGGKKYVPRLTEQSQFAQSLIGRN